MGSKLSDFAKKGAFWPDFGQLWQEPEPDFDDSGGIPYLLSDFRRPPGGVMPDKKSTVNKFLGQKSSQIPRVAYPQTGTPSRRTRKMGIINKKVAQILEEGYGHLDTRTCVYYDFICILIARIDAQYTIG